MPGVSGSQVNAAFAKFAANSWNVAASVTKGIYLKNDGGIKLAVNVITDDAFGQTFLRAHDVGNAPAQALTLGDDPILIAAWQKVTVVMIYGSFKLLTAQAIAGLG